ncbi:MAG: bacteriophage abortive infection AbiH family protein [Comamonadaceae bacterium]|nr:bacteriophage abortive infection AbiH family protein [Comamonadaceae bacterium]
MNPPPTQLYVIGNGFDLWHRVPSGFDQFKAYVGASDSRIEDDVERYLAADESWSDLEVALASLDVDGIIDDMGQFMGSYGDDDWSDSGHHDFQFEVENVVSRLSSELVARFSEWIRSLPIPTSTTPGIPRLRTLDPFGAYLNFNYTNTLTELYAIPDERILHIHGKASQPNTELILGHGWKPEKRRPLHRSEDEEHMDIRLIEAHGILDDYFSRTFKPSERLIRENQSFFCQLGMVQQVHVLGHSLSDVDLPYLQALMSVPNVAAAHWCTTYYPEEKRNSMQRRLVELGVAPERASTAPLSDY